MREVLVYSWNLGSHVHAATAGIAEPESGHWFPEEERTREQSRCTVLLPFIKTGSKGANIPLTGRPNATLCTPLSLF